MLERPDLSYDDGCIEKALFMRMEATISPQRRGRSKFSAGESEGKKREIP